MLITLDAILSPPEVAAACAFMAQGEFLEGALSAGAIAKGVKHNEELDQSSDIFNRLNEVVFKKLMRHPDFQAATLPNKTAAPFIRGTQRAWPTVHTLITL